jgi:signal transduction histidine kinase
VIGDEDLLRRMLVNLMQNAVQHSPGGARVKVEFAADSRAVTISVTDQGRGIPLPDQQRIFDRFVQVDRSRRGSGAGLGLPIARWIAEAHGGSLHLHSSSATGTAFQVILPVVDA